MGKVGGGGGAVLVRVSLTLTLTLNICFYLLVPQITFTLVPSFLIPKTVFNYFCSLVS